MSVFTLVTEWFVFVVKGSKQFKGVFFRSHGCKHFVSRLCMQSAYLYKYKDVRANRPHEWLLLLTSGEIAFIRQTSRSTHVHLEAEVGGRSLSMAH